VDNALRYGLRGLPGGSSLARLLAEGRGVRNQGALPPLTEVQVLAWADAYRARTGRWPSQYGGPVADAPGETWSGVNLALWQGGRGLPGGSSLSDLLRRRRGHRDRLHPPRLTCRQILAWADAHRARTARWPAHQSGPVADAPGETWAAVQDALRRGTRGLPGGSSLAELLRRRRGRRNPARLPRLTEARVLRWAWAHYRRHGRWPTAESGPVEVAPGETWKAAHLALVRGRRGLPGGSSLAQLLGRLKARAARTRAKAG
jgi:hypothetical protein